MRCFFNLVSSHHTIIDEEGLEVADMEEAHAFAREAVTEMVQDGIAEIAHWRGWQMEDEMLPEPSCSQWALRPRSAEDQAAETSANETYAYNKAA